jgi:hypothetical protein
MRRASVPAPKKKTCASRRSRVHNGFATPVERRLHNHRPDRELAELVFYSQAGQDALRRMQSWSFQENIGGTLEAMGRAPTNSGKQSRPLDSAWPCFIKDSQFSLKY